MKRYIRVFLLGILMMFGLINNASSASVATSFQLPLADYPVDDACRKWKWYGDFDGDGDSEYHIADDACASAGTDVYAVANGTVMYAGSYTACPNWQYLIIVQHTLPDGSLVNSIYGHIAPIDGISAGVEVTKGQHIGDLVSMDCWDDHIHFGIYVGSFTDIACYAPGNCKAAGYASSTGSYTDPVDFIVDHQSTCTSTSTTYPVHLMTVESGSTAGTYNIYGYMVNGSGDGTKLTGDYWSLASTGNSTNLKNTWLAGDINSDGYDDVVNVTDTGSYTYAQVYLSNGTGGLGARTQWLRVNDGYKYAFLADMNDDGKSDLILGYSNSDSTMLWRYYLSDGAQQFGSYTTWSSSFGRSADIFIVGDFNGNGKGELLRGRETDGTTDHNFTSALIWKRLESTGSDSTVLSSFGFSADSYLTQDVVNNDGKDELIRIDLADSTVTATVITYNTSTNAFNGPLTYATDVGGTDGQYDAYPIDYADPSGYSYADLIRFNGSDLWLSQNDNGSSFEEQSNESTMLTGISSSALFLFGDFGDYSVSEETCISTTSISGSATSTSTTLDPTTFWYSSVDMTSQGAVDGPDSATDIRGYVNDLTGTYRVTFTGGNGYLYTEASASDGQAGTWSTMSLTNQAWIPLVQAGVSTTPFYDPISGAEEALTIGDDGNLWFMTIDGTTAGITATNASSSSYTGVPYANGSTDPTGYYDSFTGDLLLYFVGTDNHLRQLRRDGTTGSWSSYDFTSVFSGWTLYPGTSAQAFMDLTTRNHYVLFTEADQRVKLLSSSDLVTWSAMDLTSLAAVDYTVSTPTGFVHPITGAFYVYLLGQDQRVYEIWYNGSWYGNDLTAQASVPYGDYGTSVSAVVNTLTGDILVTFQGDNHRINQFRYRNSAWTATDLTSQISVEYARAGATPQTFIDPFTGAETTLFAGSNHRIQLIRFGPAFE